MSTALVKSSLGRISSIPKDSKYAHPVSYYLPKTRQVERKERNPKIGNSFWTIGLVVVAGIVIYFLVKNKTSTPPTNGGGGTTVNFDDTRIVAALTQIDNKLNNLYIMESNKIPNGLKPIERSLNTSVTRIDLNPPWLGFSMINDGDDSVYVSINGDEFSINSPDNALIKKNETFNLEMQYPKINQILLRADTSTATVRIYGKQA